MSNQQPEENEYYQSHDDEPEPSPEDFGEREPTPAEYNEGMDYSHLMDSLDGYSNEYGDQKLINVIKEWLNTRMGGKWELKNKKTGLKTISY